MKEHYFSFFFGVDSDIYSDFNNRISRSNKKFISESLYLSSYEEGVETAIMLNNDLIRKNNNISFFISQRTNPEIIKKELLSNNVKESNIKIIKKLEDMPLILTKHIYTGYLDYHLYGSLFDLITESVIYKEFYNTEEKLKIIECYAKLLNHISSETEIDYTEENFFLNLINKLKNEYTDDRELFPYSNKELLNIKMDLNNLYKKEIELGIIEYMLFEDFINNRMKVFEFINKIYNKLQVANPIEKGFCYIINIENELDHKIACSGIQSFGASIKYKEDVEKDGYVFDAKKQKTRNIRKESGYFYPNTLNIFMDFDSIKTARSFNEENLYVTRNLCYFLDSSIITEDEHSFLSYFNYHFHGLSFIYGKNENSLNKKIKETVELHARGRKAINTKKNKKDWLKEKYDIFFNPKKLFIKKEKEEDE
tara:strand:+ start:46523 stop:47794 length:1272 start_codon:yes stop_codon:yes gene_type:complete